MAYGMHTTNRSRVAVQEFRGRARKIWGASTEVPEPSVFNDHEREEIEEDREDEDESHLAEIAQLNLAILQAEAEDLDLLGSKVEVDLPIHQKKLERKSSISIWKKPQPCVYQIRLLQMLIPIHSTQVKGRSTITFEDSFWTRKMQLKLGAIILILCNI